MKTQAGFTLMELIAAMVLLGFIAVFASVFLSTGMRGALMSRQAEENGQKAQIALERIALELRDISSTTTVSAIAITYATGQAKLTGTRTLAYSSAAKTITLTPAAGGTARILVDGVESCTMSFSGTSYTTILTVSFTLTNSPGTFSISVKPRQAVLSL